MLKVNPNDVLINNRNILEISENLDLLILSLNTNYYCLDSNIRNRIDFNTDKFREKVTKELRDRISFISDTVHELEEATGESMQELINHKYSMNYYEDRIIAYYADIFYKENAENRYSALANQKRINLEVFYNFWNTGQGKTPKFEVYLEIRKFQDNFDYNRFGLDPIEVRNELVYIYLWRGINDMKIVMHALTNNCPNNYESYNFNPKELSPPYSNKYDLDTAYYGIYKVYTETININGIDFEYVQTLPNDSTKIERLVYNFTKANICNTLRCLPKEYIYSKTATSNAIVAVHDRNLVNSKSNDWAAYYIPNAYGNNDDAKYSIILDAHDSLTNISWYSQIALIHELGHKFDDSIADYEEANRNDIKKVLAYGTAFINPIAAIGCFFAPSFVDTFISQTDTVLWNNYYNNYKNITQAITRTGYNPPPNNVEFFAEAITCYFIAPDELKRLAPDLYDSISQMLEYDYGSSFNSNMNALLNN